jgi:GAF domain-containing protein
MKRFSFVFSEKMKKHMGQLPPAPDWESTPRPGADGGYSREDVAKLMRSEQLAKVLAMMYRSLVDASPARCVSNCEALLRNVNRLFNATATCVMKRTGRADDSMTIYAQAGQKLVWGDAGAEGYPVSASIVRNCVLQGSVATSNPMLQDPSASMMAYNIEATAAAPIVVEGETVGILYADRRDDKRPFNQDDCEAMRKVVKVFEEFPRLTLGVN